MQLLVGAQRFDLGSRALVIGRLGSVDGGGRAPGHGLVERARALVAAGADVVELCIPGGAPERRVSDAITALVAIGAAPVSCFTTSAPLARAALSAGAALCHDPAGLRSPELLAAVAGSAAVVVADAGADPARLPGMVERAQAAGIATACLVAAVAPVADGRWNAQLAARAWRQAGAAGIPVLATLPPDPACVQTTVGHTVGSAVLAIAAGCRLLRGHDVQVLRRVADTCAGVIEAR